MQMFTRMLHKIKILESYIEKGLGVTNAHTLKKHLLTTY